MKCQKDKPTRLSGSGRDIKAGSAGTKSWQVTGRCNLQTHELGHVLWKKLSMPLGYPSNSTLGEKKSCFDGENKSNLGFLHFIPNVPLFFTILSHSRCFALLSPSLCPTAASLENLSMEGCGVGRAGGGAVFLHPSPR